MLKYNKQKIQYVVAVATTLSLSGCGWFAAKDGTEEIDDRYMQSQQGPELQMPPSTSELQVSDEQYRIPEGVVITDREAKGKSLNLEPPQLLLIGGDGIREDKEQENPTVWVRNSGTEMMDYIQRFVTAKEIPVASSNQKSISTDWISDEDETVAGEYLGSYNIEGQRHRFELEVIASSDNEVGLQAKHVASEQLLNDNWSEVQTSQQIAKQFLNYFLGYYDTVRTREARARILQEGAIDFSLGTNNSGGIALVTDKGFQNVWDQLPRVIEKLNLSVTDRDQSKKTYYFNVKEPETGIWNSLFGDDNTNPKVELEPGDYQLRLSELESGVAITFYDNQGNLLAADKVTKIYPEFSAAFRSRAAKQ